MPDICSLKEVRKACESAGLAFRGAFHPEAEDLPAGEAAGTLVMLGFVGGEQWAGFTASSEYKDGKPHPLNRWSYRVISALARDLGARPYFPFTAPLMPFMKWAQKAEPVYPSAIGMLIHPDYGLWHAWRGALAFRERFILPASDLRPSPCDGCAEKPCLSACPVDAFARSEFAVDTCKKHIANPEGVDCMDLGCRSRRACPVGQNYRYKTEQAAFHMRSFRGD